MSLLFGARSSPPLHQFLVSSLSELVGCAVLDFEYFQDGIFDRISETGAETCHESC